MRLLILACSATKRHNPGLLPAWVRYEGPTWRVLRSSLQGPQPPLVDLDVYALSAEFGLIPAVQPIPDHNRRLDAARADAIRPLVIAALERALSHGTLLWGGYQATMICGGRLYQGLLPDSLPTSCGIITRSSGGIGMQLQQLKRWLDQDA